MIDAFVHPPTLLVLNRRIDGDRVIVLSHIELWPWRTVVCGVIANRRFAPPDPPSPRGHVDSSTARGIVTAQLVAQSDEARTSLRQSIEWMSAWTLTDDANTVYELDGWNGAPTTEQLWSDVAWRYRTVLTRVIASRDDRFFPLEFQQRVARDRLGIEPEIVPGGHLIALSRPIELADALLGARTL